MLLGPFDASEKLVLVNLVSVLKHKFHHAGQHFIGQIVGGETKINESGVFGIVIVFLSFPSGDWANFYSHLQPQGSADPVDFFSQIIDGKSLGELVENAKAAGVRRIFRGQTDTIQGILDIEIASCLAATAIYSEGIAGHRLNDKSVKDRAKNLVII